MIISPEILIFLLAMAPISEVRGSIPLGILVFKIPFWKVFLIAFLGSTLSIIILLLFLEPVSGFLSKHSKFFKNFFDWLFKNTRRKVSSRIEKYREWGILLISAIPLPLFGVWTGALAAFLFDIPFKLAFPLIFVGNLVAIIMVGGLTISGIAVEKIFGWPTLLGVIILVLFFWLVYRFISRKK
jgi:uncharacterized membrane protein